MDRDKRYSTLAPTTQGDILSLHGNTVTQETALNIAGDQYDENGQQIQEGGTARQIASYAYQGGIGLVDSLARVAAGGGAAGGAALAAANSFSQTVSDASRQGASPEQAYKLGVAVAGVEYLSEKIPMDKMLKVGKGGKTKVIADILKQGGIEIAAEEISLIGSFISELAIMKEKSSYKQRIGDLVSNGMSYGEAQAQANKELIAEAKQTAIVSGFAGIFGGGSAATANWIDAAAAEIAAKSPSAPATTTSPEEEALMHSFDAAFVEDSQQPATPTATTEAAPQPETVQNVLQKMRESGTGVSNRMAESVLGDPEAMAYLQEQTGVEISGTKAERRRAARDALSRLFNGDISSLVEVQEPVQAQTAPAEQPGLAEQIAAMTEDLLPIPEKALSPEEQGARAALNGISATENQEFAPPAKSVPPTREIKESRVYGNTYQNATNDDIQAVGTAAQDADPTIGQYEVITEADSLEEARMRTDVNQSREAEHKTLMEKSGWSGADNDTAMRLLMEYQKEGKAEQLRELARKQQEMGTQAGQMAQSFAKYSREDATVAVLDAVKTLERMGISDVPKKFWKGTGDRSAERQASFEAWKTSVTKSMLDISNDIEAVPEGDAEAMRGIVRQLAQFRRTTAWFGTQNHLTKNADRILNKMDFETAKTIAKAQLATIPDDFRKRSAGEIAKTIRIHNMLSALTTVGRNTVGNATMGIVDAFSDSTTARAMDAAMSKFTGIRTVGNDMKYAGTYFNAARDAADMASLCVELNIPMETESRYSAGNTRTHSTQGGPLARFLSAYEKYMKYSLEVSDKFFEGGTTAAVNQSIRDLGAKAGLSDNQIAGLAERAGNRRTFKEDRNLSRGAKKVKEGANIMFGAGDVGAGDILMPFAGVPMDIGQTAADYSGSGMALGIKEMVDVIRAAQNGEKTIKNQRTGTEMPLEIAQRKAVSDFGRGVTGVGLVALSAVGSALGAIKVHDSKDWEEKGMEQAQNLDGAQINLSAISRGLSADPSEGDPTEWKHGEDIVMGMDFLEPFNSSLHIGYMLSQEPDFISMVKNYPKHAFTGVMEAVLDLPVMTLLSEIQALVQSIGETDEEGNPATMDALGQVAGTVATSAVPSFIRQTAQTIDPNYRDTYDPDPWKQAGNKVLASIPFASKLLPEKYDGLGNVQKRYDDTTARGTLMGALNNLVLPDDVERIGGNEITEYLGTLSDETGETSMYPEEQAPYKFTVRGEEVELTGDQRATYQKTYGEKNSELYGGLINYPGFADLPEDVQIDAFERAKAYSTRFAKAAVADFRDVPAESSEDLVKGIVNSSLNSMFSGAFDDLTESWKFGYDTAGAVHDLDAAYDVLASTPGFEEFKDKKASGRVKYYLNARDSGISTETFTSLYGEYRDIDASDSLNSTQKAHEWAVILEDAVTDGDITEKQKDGLKEQMVFRYSLVAETKKFDAMIDAGLETDEAKYVVDLLADVKGTGSWDIDAKKYTVRDIDKREAIARSDLSFKDKDRAMKSYMADYDPNDESPEKTEVKYSYIREVMGLTPTEYAETYRAYLDAPYKADKIEAIERLGYGEATATELYYIFNGNQKKVPTVEWYEERYGL